jgi:hypothetical protein
VPGWYSAQKLHWVHAGVNGGGAAYLDGVSEKYLFGTQSYNPVRLGAPGMSNVLGLMQSAMLGNRSINLEVDEKGWIVSVVLLADPAIPVPPAATVESIAIQIPAFTKFDGTIRSAYAKTESQVAWIFVDGRAAPADKNTGGPDSRAVRGWVKISADATEASSRVFNIAGQAAALSHPVRIYTHADRNEVNSAYLWRK